VKTQNRSALFYWIPLLAYCALIFYLSSLTFTGSYPLPGDKTIHFVEYSVLGFFVAALLKHYFQLRIVFIILFATLLGGFYGVSDEFHQSFVPGRESSVLDALADVAGSFMGASLYVFYRRLQKSPTPNS